MQVDSKAFMGPPKPLAHQKNGHFSIQAEGGAGSVRAGCTVRGEHNGKLGSAATAPWFLRALKVGRCLAAVAGSRGGGAGAGPASGALPRCRRGGPALGLWQAF
jgi:hypothetical protein